MTTPVSKPLPATHPILATTPLDLCNSAQHTPFPGTPPPYLCSKRASVLVQHLHSVPTQAPCL